MKDITKVLTQSSFCFVSFIFISLLSGLIGSFFTSFSVDSWYANLTKPFFNPPVEVFGTVWIVLFILIGASAFVVFQKGFEKKDKRVLAFFVGLLFLNIAWSALFFALQSPILAFIEIIALLFLIAVTIFFSYKIEKFAAYLLIPYLLWVFFSAILNLAIIILN